MAQSLTLKLDKKALELQDRESKLGLYEQEVAVRATITA